MLFSVFNRPCVAGAVIEEKNFVTHSLIQSVSHPFPQNLQNAFTPKPSELGSGHLRECSPPTNCHLTHVICHISSVTCYLPPVTCHLSHVMFFVCFIVFYKLEKLFGRGSVINGADSV